MTHTGWHTNCYAGARSLYTRHDRRSFHFNPHERFRATRAPWTAATVFGHNHTGTGVKRRVRPTRAFQFLYTGCEIFTTLRIRHRNIPTGWHDNLRHTGCITSEIIGIRVLTGSADRSIFMLFTTPTGDHTMTINTDANAIRIATDIVRNVIASDAVNPDIRLLVDECTMSGHRVVVVIMRNSTVIHASVTMDGDIRRVRVVAPNGHVS